MVDIKVLDLPNLKGKEKAAYKGLVGKKYLGCLSGDDPMKIEESHLFGLGAIDNGTIAGLLLGAFRPGNVTSQLYTVALDHEYQGKGVGEQLLKHFEGLLRERQAPRVMTHYQLERPETAPFEALLKNCGWELGNQVLVSCHFNAQTFAPPWLHRNYPLPPGCSQFMWSEITDNDRKTLDNYLEQGAIPGELSPFIMEKLIDKKSSIGLRDAEGNIVGWMINVRTDRETIEFRSIFVFRDYYSMGHAMRLLTESIRRVQSGKPPRHALMNTHMEKADLRWIKFVRHRLLPYTESVDRFAEAWKQL